MAFWQAAQRRPDGSSVVLTGIATLNDARVDMKVDKTVNWFVDYNYEHFDAKRSHDRYSRIPCYLIHNGNHVDSRSILNDTLAYVEKEIMDLFAKHPVIAGLEHVNPAEIEKLLFTSATGLEFW